MTGREASAERDEHDRCTGCLYSAGHALDCPLYPQPEPGRQTTPEPFPVGHGLDLDRASAVCLCGVLIHECVEMLRWGFRRQEQLRQEAPDA